MAYILLRMDTRKWGTSVKGQPLTLQSQSQVIQGIPNGQEKSLTMIAILSGPRWNATAETLTFSMRHVTSEAALKLRDGVANGALAGGRCDPMQGFTCLEQIIIIVKAAEACLRQGMFT